MRKYLLIPTTFLLALIGLTSCTSLSEQDRAYLMETRRIAEEARMQAEMAARDAKAASLDTNTAASAARAASEKADRIFQEGQMK